MSTSELSYGSAILTGSYPTFLIEMFQQEAEWAAKAKQLDRPGDTGKQKEEARFVRYLLDRYLFDEPMPRHKKAPTPQVRLTKRSLATQGYSMRIGERRHVALKELAGQAGGFSLNKILCLMLLDYAGVNPLRGLWESVKEPAGFGAGNANKVSNLQWETRLARIADAEAEHYHAAYLRGLTARDKASRLDLFRLLVSHAQGEHNMVRPKVAQPAPLKVRASEKQLQPISVKVALRADQMVWLRDLGRRAGRVSISGLITLFLLEYCGINPMPWVFHGYGA